MSKINFNLVKDILSIYPDEEIFVKSVAAGEKDNSIIIEFVVPQGSSYTDLPIPYVSAEQYVRCLSQLSYLVGFLLVLPEENFDENLCKSLRDKFRMYYRKINYMKFRKLVGRGEPFKVSATYSDIKRYKQDRLLVKIDFTGKVIEGTVDFVIILP